jgi:predicted MPP superfamily phosphohydrolase
MRLKIAALADLHAGEPYMSAARVGSIVERANALNPDLIVLLGDYTAERQFVFSPAPIRETARILSYLKAPLGVYGVLGNHDWWDDLGAQKRGTGPTISHQAFADVGIPVLENQARRLSISGRPFWLVGLGDQLAFPARLRRRVDGPKRRYAPSINPSAGVDDLSGAMSQVTDEEPVILLAHEPDIFPRLSPRIALALAGHTHGGQVRFFGYSPVVPSRYGGRYAYGVVEETGKTFVVSGGLGCSVMPVRFGIPPEITVVELG